jgi:hypothetical protein
MIRYFELGPSNPEGLVPAAVSTYREQIRAASHSACQALTGFYLMILKLPLGIVMTNHPPITL